MPELPEVEGLAAFLRDRAVGHTVAAVDVGAIWALKTFAPAPADLVGREVTAVARHGKWIDVATDGPHLLLHLLLSHLLYLLFLFPHFRSPLPRPSSSTSTVAE